MAFQIEGLAVEEGSKIFFALVGESGIEHLCLW